MQLFLLLYSYRTVVHAVIVQFFVCLYAATAIVFLLLALLLLSSLLFEFMIA